MRVMQTQLSNDDIVRNLARSFNSSVNLLSVKVKVNLNSGLAYMSNIQLEDDFNLAFITTLIFGVLTEKSEGGQHSKHNEILSLSQFNKGALELQQASKSAQSDGIDFKFRVDFIKQNPSILEQFNTDLFHNTFPDIVTHFGYNRLDEILMSLKPFDTQKPNYCVMSRY